MTVLARLPLGEREGAREAEVEGDTVALLRGDRDTEGELESLREGAGLPEAPSVGDWEVEAQPDAEGVGTAGVAVAQALVEREALGQPEVEAVAQELGEKVLLGVPVGDADAGAEPLLSGVGDPERAALPVGCPRDADAQGDGEPLREAVPHTLPVVSSEVWAVVEAEGEGGGLRERDAERQGDGDAEVLTLHDRVGSVVLLSEEKEVGEGVARMEPVLASLPLAEAVAVSRGVAEADTLGLPLREAVSQRDAVPALRLADTLPLSVAQGRDPEGVAVSQ